MTELLDLIFGAVFGSEAKEPGAYGSELDGREVRGAAVEGRLELRLSLKEPLSAPLRIWLRDYPALWELSLTSAQLGEDGVLSVRGVDAKGVSELRVEEQELVMLLNRAPERRLFEAMAEALIGLAQALEEEAQRSRWRGLARERGWSYEPHYVSGWADRVRVRLVYLRGRTHLELIFSSRLPQAFKATTPERLGHPGDGFDNMVLDLLLAVESPPPDQRFHRPEMVELLLELLHGQTGELRRNRLDVWVPGRMRDPRCLVQAALDLVEGLEAA